MTDRELVLMLLEIGTTGADAVSATIVTEDNDWQPLLIVADHEDEVNVIGIPGQMLNNERGKDMIAAMFTPIAHDMEARAMCFVTSANVKVIKGDKAEMVTLMAASREEMALQIGRTVRTPDGATIEWEEPMFDNSGSEMQGRFPDAMRAALRT